MTQERARYARPWVRVAILMASLAVGSGIAYAMTGQLLPSDPRDALIYQTSLLLLVLGSALVEHRFTKPADALVNSLMGLLTLTPVYSVSPKAGWWAFIAYTLLVFLASATCVALSDGPTIMGRRARIAAITYRFATFFGRARLYFSLLLLFGLWSFYWLQDPRVVLLVVFWGIYLAIWPLGLPTLLGAVNLEHRLAMPTGAVLRTEWPNILRIKVSDPLSWGPNRAKLCRQLDGTTGWVLPLYTEQQTDQVIGTGLFIPSELSCAIALEPGAIYEPPSEQVPTPSDIAAALGVPVESRMVGFVVEDSEIATIRFETWDPTFCREGSMVWVSILGKPIYYQILNGLTREESSESNRRGFQVAFAAQVGEADPARGFLKYPWLPSMNAPVFAVPSDFGITLFPKEPHEFTLGTIPSTHVPVRLIVDEALAHHVAILGVTGAGKTELAFDLIRHACGSGTKVICIDLTARYAGRLNDLTPRQLSLDEPVAKELSDKLFAVETGQFKASDEKKALEQFASKLRLAVANNIKAFLETMDDDNRVGIVTLPEISNTKATLFITELYLTLLLRYAKSKGAESPPILIVLEEAHTVIPEASTMGLSDNESKGLVGKMAQIALQGRKYRVGLLVIAQRTATVSKTVLTQCNTVISFSCIDDTSIGFLTNVYGSSFARLLPNLPPLQAVVFGKGVRSQRPLIFQVPFDSAKVASGA